MIKHHHTAQGLTLLGAASNILLAVIKILGGLYGHSHALIADGIHSLADLVTDCVVLLATRFSSQKADIKYPYGYARVETLATAALALLLLATGLGIIYDAGHLLFEHHTSIAPSFYVLLIALFSLLIKEVLFRYTLKFAKKLHSPLLKANAWHHRSDAAASLVVLVGIIGALLGFLHLDAFASIIVAIMIIKMGWELTFTSVRELIDVGLDITLLKQIEKSILAIEGVRAIHQLRARSMGGKVFLDMHLLVSPSLSVSEGHFIAAKTQRDLMNLMPNIADITIHVDPEDDEDYDSNYKTLNLPPRDELHLLLKQRWETLLLAEEIKRVRLDYLATKISIVVTRPITRFVNEREAHHLRKQLQERLADIAFIRKVSLVYEIN
ncbi:MAG: cation transporter [Gammaproteobacteria bacterium]|nr:cation transporter [Gammaproteobacteria bacterium]